MGKKTISIETRSYVAHTNTRKYQVSSSHLHDTLDLNSSSNNIHSMIMRRVINVSELSCL